ncbi:MAG: Hsp20/alpha crystallin family protein [Acidobacteria bacterium]|nr:Hsp20/alpha crystallin family protein [Acidobacteriota bacterium]
MTARSRREAEFAGGESISWTPSVDIYETDEAFFLIAELPGVRQEDIRIEVSGSELSIRGERRYEAACLPEIYQRLEAPRGRFHREFTLPARLIGDAISANLKDGVLEVRLPKATKGRTITIETASAGR